MGSGRKLPGEAERVDVENLPDGAAPFVESHFARENCLPSAGRRAAGRLGFGSSAYGPVLLVSRILLQVNSVFSSDKLGYS